MKKYCIILLFFFFLAFNAESKDFIVKFVHENYKEVRAQFSFHPVIYHSIQINSAAGPKLIILKGENNTYRKWVRDYIAKNKQFILRVDDSENDSFIASKAFELDIDAIHPINVNQWTDPDISGKQPKSLSGDNFILIFDSDERRTRLIKTIAEKKGFQVLVSTTGTKSLGPFKLQPEKFRMVIANHQILASEDNENLIDNLVKIDHNIPVIIDSGYRNDSLRKAFESKFRKYPSVIVKPVILRELSQMIEFLTSEKA